MKTSIAAESAKQTHAIDKPAKMGRKCNQKSYITNSFEVFESVEFGDLSYILNLYD